VVLIQFYQAQELQLSLPQAVAVAVLLLQAMLMVETVVQAVAQHGEVAEVALEAQEQ
jgi:hypothetical protein